MSIPKADGSDHDHVFATDNVAVSHPEFAQFGPPPDLTPEGYKPLMPEHGPVGPLVKPYPVNQPADGAAPNAPAGQVQGREGVVNQPLKDGQS